MNISERIFNPKAKEVYMILRRQGTVSRFDLLEQTRLTGSTLTRVLEELIAPGWIEEVGFGESTGGRRPILYRTNPAGGYALGLDISRTYARLVLCDLHMSPVAVKDWRMTERMTPDDLIDRVVAAIQAMLSARDIGKERLLGMGIGAVGPLDRSEGVILDPVFFPAPGWNHVPICERFESELGVPVFLENGANSAILGEYWAAVSSDYRHLLYIHAGVGLRSAMMSNGKLVYGAVDMEGSIGQMVIQADGIRHRSGGNYGSLESYTTIHAIERQAQSRLKLGRSGPLKELCADPEKVSFSQMLKALESGDSMVEEIFVQAAAYFGIGMANLLNILHPEKVILGGPLMMSQDLFYREAIRVAVQNTYYYPKYQVMFDRGKLGEEAIATGSAAMVIDRLSE